MFFLKISTLKFATRVRALSINLVSVKTQHEEVINRTPCTVLQNICVLLFIVMVDFEMELCIISVECTYVL